MMKDVGLRLRIGIYIFLTVVLFLAQTTEGLALKLFGEAPLLLIPATVCFGVFEREAVGGYLGLFAGLLWDITSFRPPGFNAVFLLAAGCVCGLLITHFMHNNLFSTMLLCGGVLLAYAVCDWLSLVIKYGAADAGVLFGTHTFPQIFYTFWYLIPIYIIIRFIIKKLRRIE